MFSPPLYGVYKFPFVDIVDSKLDMRGDLSKYKILQQDNMLFRQIRLITGDGAKFNKYCVFVSCRGVGAYPEDFDKIVLNGFYVDGKKFVISERSASMTRQGILSFVEGSISEQLEEAVTLGVKVKETVLSKYMAYRGLMFSSCHCIEDWIPPIVIIPDGFRVVKNQDIKYADDEITEFTDKETGELRTWKQKVIRHGTKDITINMFDGCGIHHPNISQIVKDKIGCEELPTSIQWRMPFIKGVTHAVDYQKFFLEHGVDEITDIWGCTHPIDQEMIIMSESMYKGVKYFKEDGTYGDWLRYLGRFRKYNHCVGVAKWNFTKEQESVYTRGNYQILQDLDLSYDDFSALANDSLSWTKKIVDDDIFYTYCYLGMFYDMHKPMNDYVRAIMKNPEMMKEKTVREYIVNLLRKYIDEFKCGKLWIKSTFKILVPDLYAFLEHCAGMEVNGCLESDEFYSNSSSGDYIGEFLIERNPHICRSEHTILKGTTNEKIKEYFSNLSNICMINIKSLTPQRLNGAD